MDHAAALAAQNRRPRVAVRLHPAHAVFWNSSRTASISASVGRSSAAPKRSRRTSTHARTPANRRWLPLCPVRPREPRRPPAFPGRVPFAEQVIGRRAGRADTALETLKVHHCRLRRRVQPPCSDRSSATRLAITSMRQLAELARFDRSRKSKGTPRSLQGCAAAVFCALFRWWDEIVPVPRLPDPVARRRSFAMSKPRPQLPGAFPRQDSRSGRVGMCSRRDGSEFGPSARASRT